MIIKSKFKDYEVSIAQNTSFINEIDTKNTFFVIDKKVFELYPSLFGDIPVDVLYLFDASESNKTIESALTICEYMTNLAAKRNAILVSCGGGIVQDVTGFVANILYRGIKWIFIPTTLLAACDSCIGGKTSLNYKKFKNLLGTFYPPDKIFIYPGFFDTLTEGDFASGLGEVVKFNVMTGKDGLQNLEWNLSLLLERNKDKLLEFVVTSLNFKKKFIEIDEFDKKERILLNFAHTFGHALEVTSRYILPHGTAVAIGMLIANRISVNRNLLSDEVSKRIETIIKMIVLTPMQSDWFDVDLMVQAIKKDKKQMNDALTAILLSDSFKLSVVHDITSIEIEAAIKSVYTLLLQSVVSV